MSKVHQLHPEPISVTNQVTEEPKGRPVAYATFAYQAYDNGSLTFTFSVKLEPETGVVEQREAVVSFNGGKDVLMRLLPMQDFRLPVTLHYNPVVDATKPDGSPYGLHELPMQESPAGLYIGHPGTYVPLQDPQL